MRSGSVVLCMALAIVALIVSTVLRPRLWLVYNVSDSAPRGLYVVDESTEVRVGIYVVARLPASSATLAAERGYLPGTVPVLKQVAAVAGQAVCVRNGVVYIDGAVIARTLDVDRRHRPLRPWNGCRVLLPHELFLLNPGNPASFDSRYFGPLDVSFVRGRATRW